MILLPMAEYDSNKIPCLRWNMFEQLDWNHPFVGFAVMKAHRAGKMRTWSGEFQDLLEYDTPPKNFSHVLFHPGRCGSTLIARGLFECGRYHVVSEPSILDWLDQAQKLGLIGEIAPYLRAVGGFYAAAMPEKATFWKTTPLDIHFHDVILNAFPGIKPLYLTRNPIDVSLSYILRPTRGADKTAKDFEVKTLQLVADVMRHIQSHSTKLGTSILEYDQLVKKKSDVLMNYLNENWSAAEQKYFNQVFGSYSKAYPNKIEFNPANRNADIDPKLLERVHAYFNKKCATR